MSEENTELVPIKRKSGRPKKTLNKSSQEMACELRGGGATYEQIAKIFNMTRVTFWRFLRDNEAFLNKLQEAETIVIDSVRGVAIERALAGDVGCIKAVLTGYDKRFQTKTSVDVSGTVTHDVQVMLNSDDIMSKVIPDIPTENKLALVDNSQ